MERIRVISIDTILPATYKPETKPQTIDLTPWDLQFLLLSSIQKGILFNHPTPYDHINSLKTSLSHTLDHFYPLAGRLRYSEDVVNDTKCYYIECNNGGVEFIEAVSDDDVTVEFVFESEYDVSVVRSLFPQNGLMNLECDVKPFLAVQVTYFAGRGCFIGCTLSHMFGDGTSFWQFMNSWSEICRRGGDGFDCLSNPPVLDRRYPLQSKLWIPNRSVVNVRKQSSGNLKEMMFNFSKEKIASLKLKAVEQSGNQRISSLQAVLAHVWRSVSKCRMLNSDDDVQFVIAIGDRTRTEPALPTHYFGNAVHLAIARLKHNEIVAAEGFGRAANQLNELISQQTRSHVMDYIRSWIDHKPVLFGTGNVLSDQSLVTSSSPKFDVYGNDFGWGRPVAVRSGGAHKMNGKVTLFTGAEEGSIDIEICLVAETLESLKWDSEFKDVA